MNISTLTKRIVALLVTLAATAPMAQASGGLTPPRTVSVSPTLSSACPCNVGLPGGPGVVRSEALSIARGSTTSSVCPCNIGLPGGPAAVRHAALASQTIAVASGSFDWADAGAGAGFMAGIAVLVGGAALVLRRQRVLARPHS
jgi:hypothetical protein